jgi:hypothetical protein
MRTTPPLAQAPSDVRDWRDNLVCLFKFALSRFFTHVLTANPLRPTTFHRLPTFCQGPRRLLGSMIQDCWTSRPQAALSQRFQRFPLLRQLDLFTRDTTSRPRPQHAVDDTAHSGSLSSPSSPPPSTAAHPDGPLDAVIAAATDIVNLPSSTRFRSHTVTQSPPPSVASLRLSPTVVTAMATTTTGVV